jgi:cell division protein ZapE
VTRVVDAYAALVAAGELRTDPEQRAAVAILDALQVRLEVKPKLGLLDRLTGSHRAAALHGVYLWGDVGRGKSMLMDLFFGTLAGSSKRRAHFHEFMLDVHARLRVARASERGDPVLAVAAELASEARVLCFDEMVVNNAADAMIMARLFTALVEAGTVIVTTSNRRPSDLYKDGLNREHFMPFIALIEARLDVVALNGPTDYRMARLDGIDLWYTPLGDAATAQARDAFFRLTDYPPEDAAHVPSADLDVGGGRLLHVPRSFKGVTVFSFKRLCGEARGAADYLAVARRYHSVIVVGIPRLGPENRNEAARFVTLIDALYEHKVKLIVTADAEPEELYGHGDGSFEFARTVSRLAEMQSLAYLAQGHGEG